jgi:hypothetical protein
VRDHRVGGRAELVEVATRAERHAVAAEVHLRDARVGGRQRERVDQGVAHRRVEGVADVWPVEGDAQHGTVAIEEHRLALRGPRAPRPRRQPRRELRAGLQGRVDGRLGAEAVVDRAALGSTQELYERDRGERAALDRCGDGIERALVARGEEHVARVSARGVLRCGAADDHAPGGVERGDRAGLVEVEHHERKRRPGHRCGIVAP